MGFPHEIKGEGIYAFVVLMDGSRDRRRAKTSSESLDDIADRKRQVENDVAAELRQAVRRQLASYAAPNVTLVCQALPKTRSGKIMRR